MQREIAEVMASCALRGFRYIAFPPIVFEAPKPLPAPQVAPPEAAVPEVRPAEPIPAVPLPQVAPALAVPPEPLPEPPPVSAVSPVPSPPPAHPAYSPPPPPSPMPQAEASAPAMRRLAEFTAAAEPELPPGRLRRLAELTAAENLDPPGEGEAPRRFALLNDIAVELRPRRVRARTSRRP